MNEDEPAFPGTWYGANSTGETVARDSWTGLTKRELIATQMACGMLGEAYRESNDVRDDTLRIFAHIAVRMADILIDEVGKPREEQP